LKAFKEFYDSIKHLNHRIVECIIGDAKPELPQTEFITRINTVSTLWHKEALLNNIVTKLPTEFKYVMWVDADVLFTNKNWMVDAVSELQSNRIVQLFEYCVHLEKDQYKPDFNLDVAKATCGTIHLRHPNVWRSFAANYVTTDYSDDHNYDKHGHVGFAWGAQKRLLEEIPLYDKALVGGADHIIAHAATGHMKHNCIKKSFTDDIDAINSWSLAFFNKTRGKLGFVKGDLYHIWHGAIEKRQYLKRIQDFTSTAKEITEKDENGLYVTDNDEYVKEYFNHREDTAAKKPIKIIKNGTYGTKSKKSYIPNDDEIQRRKRELQRQYPDSDDSFIESLLVGYFTDSTMMGTAVGGDILGAAIGDMLNNTDQINEHSQESGFDGGFGGGGFSGGGAGGEWQDNSQTDTQTENFS
jgi:uncharacterized membrane protein YgcG